MVKINVSMAKSARSNHKRSFDFQRKNYLSGKSVDKKSVPTRWVANQYETFESYESDLYQRMSSVFNERLGLFVPNESRDIDICLKTTPGLCTLAQYCGINSAGNVCFNFRLDDLVCAFYFPDEDQKEFELSQVKRTTDHELRHHVDKRFLAHSDRLESICNIVSQREVKFGCANAAHLLNKYLRELRIEGFGEFSDSLSMPHRIQLKKQTDILVNGIAKLESQPEINRLEWFNYCDENRFSSYSQGKTMFRVIALAERMKLDGMEPKSLEEIKPEKFGISPLFDTPERFQYYIGLLKRIASIRSYSDFIKYYSSCADHLKLEDSERVIPRTVSDRLISTPVLEFLFQSKYNSV